MAREIVFVLLFNLLTKHIWKEKKITVKKHYELHVHYTSIYNRQKTEKTCIHIMLKAF